MELTRERIAELVSDIEGLLKRGSKMAAIKIVRDVLSFGIKEAMAYLDNNAYNEVGLAKIRKDFESMARLEPNGSEPRIFDRPNFRFTMKRGDATPEQVKKFFDDTMAEILKDK
jgi:hypothetical protein